MEKELGIYVHIPFCIRKCAYCDFISYPNKLEMQEDRNGDEEQSSVSTFLTI